MRIFGKYVYLFCFNELKFLSKNRRFSSSFQIKDSCSPNKSYPFHCPETIVITKQCSNNRIVIDDRPTDLLLSVIKALTNLTGSISFWQVFNSKPPARKRILYIKMKFVLVFIAFFGFIVSEKLNLKYHINYHDSDVIIDKKNFILGICIGISRGWSPPFG